MTEWIVTSSAIVLIVIALRGLSKGRISLKLQYGLWALVLVRLLIPFSIVDSAISVSNILTAPAIREADSALTDYRESYEAIQQDAEARGEAMTDDDFRAQVQQELFDRTYSKAQQDLTQSGTPVQTPEVQTELRAEVQQQVQVISLTAVVTEALPYLWIIGMIAVAAALICANLHFGWKLRQSRKALYIPGVPLNTYLTDYVATPCLFGLVKPDIYLTAEVVTDTQLRRHVIAHEMSHYRQGDHIWSMLRCICLVLHWYNPLVWVAAVLSKKDAELACDEATIKTLGENERTAYGRTLIGMTCVRRDPRSLMLTATTMLGTKKTLKDRISLIAKRPKTALYTLVVCIVVAAIAVGCTFTGATKSEEERLLDRCREAVEYIQEMQYFEIVETTELNEASEDVLGGMAESGRYVYSGESWYISRSFAGLVWEFAQISGEKFQKLTTNTIPEDENQYSDWVMMEQIESLYCKDPWIMNLSWNGETVEYEGVSFTPLSVSSQVLGSQEFIQVELTQSGEVQEEIIGWFLTFRFDAYSGEVTEIKREIHGLNALEVADGGQNSLKHYTTNILNIYTGTEQDMLDTIERLYHGETDPVVPTGPTEPTADPVLNWELPDYPQLSYEEYFSEIRYYYYAEQGTSPSQQYYWGGWSNGKNRCEVWIEDGRIFAGSAVSGEYVQVGTEIYENTKITCCDEFWIYAIKDQTELFRIDYNGENRQTLYVDETQKIAPFDITYTHVRDNSVLFFVAAAGSDYGIYRLYLPDMTLDLLYTTEEKPFLYEPYSNFEITWSSNVKEVVDNVYEIDYYYNCLTGQLLDRPVYGDRSWGNSTWAWWVDMLVEQFQELLKNDEWLSRIMGTIFEKPNEISLEYMFYRGLPYDEREDPSQYLQTEVGLLKNALRDTLWGDDAWDDAYKFPVYRLDEILNQYLGVSLEDVVIPDRWIYLSETNAYYDVRTDSYGVVPTVTDVRTDENGWIYVYWTTNYIRDTRSEELKFINEPQMLTVLEKMADGSYRVYMNLPVEELLGSTDVEYFQNLLTYENGYWYWMAMGCVFEGPDELNLEYLFYNGLPSDEGQNSSDFTDSEVQFLQAYAREKYGDESVWVNAHKLPREAVNDVLSTYFAVTLNTVSIPEDWVYFEETDSYYDIRFDAYGVVGYTITSVKTDSNGFVYVFWTTQLLRDTRYQEPVYLENPRMVMMLMERKDGGYAVHMNENRPELYIPG